MATNVSRTGRIAPVHSQRQNGEAGAPGTRTVALTITLAVLGVFVTYVPITAVSDSLTTIGASMSSALHTSLNVNGVLLLIAAIVCATTVRLGHNTAS